jgi:SAM-dependent methyltransferase
VGEAWATHVERLARFYTGLVEQYGHHPRACDYGRPQSQRLKFEVLAEVMDLRGRRVLDVGCGFADFADYLAERHPGVVYEGVDITPRMIVEARRLHPGLSLRVLDILEDDPGGPYDLVTANGIFYLLADEPEARMQRLIARMYALSRGAVAFNTHSGWAPYREPHEFYSDPLATVAFCRTLTPWVVLRHDYMAHDFSAFLYREPGGRRG